MLYEKLQGWFEIAEDFADLHLRVDEQAYCRNKVGDVVPIDGMPKVTLEDLVKIMGMSTATELQKEIESRGGQWDTSINYGGRRFRVNAFRFGETRYALVMRYLKNEIPLLADLGLSSKAQSLIRKKSGIILITGVTGSGKSTTTASMVQEAANAPGHIITLEDPIEYLYPGTTKARITQRCIGVDTDSFKAGLRASLREDPDIIVVGEIRDAETAEIALQAADTGHLVLSTLHTRSAPDTIERFVNLFPSVRHQQAQHMLANALVGVISQNLLRRKDGAGRVLAYELMTPEGGVKENIRNGKFEQLYGDIHGARKEFDMTTLNQTLERLVVNDEVDADTALASTTRPDELARNLNVGG